MKQTGGKVWENYQNYVINTLKNTESSTEGKSLYDIKYEAKKSVYAENDIDEEIAADYIGEMFTDVKELSKFIRNNRKQALSVRNIYYAVLDKLGLLSEKKKVQRLWAEAYREAMKNKDAEFGDETHESKSGTRVDDSSENQYNNTEQYRTMWTIEEGVLSRSEVRQFYSEIQNLANGSEKYEVSLYGDYIFEIGNNLVYTDGDFEYPTISKVVTFNVENKTEFYDVKEFYNDISNTTESEELSQSITEDVYGEGVISRRNFEESKAYERQNKQRKGTNSSTTDRRTRKSVSGTRVTDNPSVSEVDTSLYTREANASLMEENKRLREQIENMHIQLDQAEGKGLDLKAVKTAAINLRKKYGSKIKVYEFHQELSKIYQLMASDLANSNEVSDRIKSLAQKVIDNATETVESEYSELLKELRKTKIKVPMEDRAEFSEGYENFRKANMGRLTLTNKGYDLDALWDDLVNEYPMFEDNITGSEARLNRILEVMDEFKPVEQDVYKTEAEKQKAVTELANDIMETFYEIPEGGEKGGFIFYDKRASQAEAELKKAKEKIDNAL